eukprot:CAMPEP_0118934510 /NCGR_PEP_ID=MMETSP1169-20130426/13867_1 /TAXON_ID=36882 /ORGANISM="Pyramimonas obovata, Strain CCMP722" /LENGTH=107 /DNA_ID=CAMNT_0006877423 /DNA_START=239 /DNA_END=558 /DNA_ORIENTATION=+
MKSLPFLSLLVMNEPDPRGSKGRDGSEGPDRCAARHREKVLSLSDTSIALSPQQSTQFEFQPDRQPIDLVTTRATKRADPSTRMLDVAMLVFHAQLFRRGCWMSKCP